MNRTELDGIQNRLDYARYVYKNAEGVFEDFAQPIAAFDRDGRIIKATGLFRKLAGITEDEIRQGGASIFNCLNNKNAGLLEAAQNVFGDGEKILTDLVRPLRVKSHTAEFQAAQYTRAAVFPFTYLSGDIEYGAVYLMYEDKSAKLKKTTRGRLLTIAAACLAVAIIGAAGLYNLAFPFHNRTDYIAIQDGQVPLAAPLPVDKAARPYTGAQPKTITVDGVKYPVMDSMTIPADTPDILLLLFNPMSNTYNLVFELVADNETLYSSGLVEPGKCIESLTLSRGLTKGEYVATLLIRAYAPDGVTKVSDAGVEISLIAEARGN